MKKKIILMSIFTALFIFMGVYINEPNSYLYSAIGIMSGWAFVYSEKLRKDAIFKLDGVCELYDDKIKENTELTAELSLFHQKYSRTNQPRSGGKFVEKDNTPVLPVPLEELCKSNLGKEIESDSSDGNKAILCGYSPYFSCMIFGLDSNDGWDRVGEDDVILKEYKSYEYGSL